jgi:hypothetical protein
MNYLQCGLPDIVTEADGTELDLVTTNGWIVRKNTGELPQCIVKAFSNIGELRSRGKVAF